MSSIYRCRTRVGYKPFDEKRIIILDEKHVSNVSVKLKWQPNQFTANQTTAASGVSTLTSSTCQVTLTDPYLTGLAWPAVFDAAKMYTFAELSKTNNLLLPTCEDGQDPLVDKCYRYYDPLDVNLAEESEAETELQRTAHLLISYWYEVNGSSFGTDYYFRVKSIQVTHGSKYPEVNISGIEPRVVDFSQNLMNLGFEEGTPVEQVIKEIADKQGYKVSYCNADYTEQFNLPGFRRERGLTVQQMLEKYLKSVGGNMVSPPTREFYKKIGVCTRADSGANSCQVFYLGKGLYRQYQIQGEPSTNAGTLNAVALSSTTRGENVNVESFDSQAFTLQKIVEGPTRESRYSNVRKVEFPLQFTRDERRYVEQSTSDRFWKDSGPEVKTEKASDINLYGVAPNGESAVAFLDGRIIAADAANGSVVIETNHFVKICRKEGEADKCSFSTILQESRNLDSIVVKSGDRVVVNQPIGSGEEFVRFKISGQNGISVTIAPQIVWEYGFPADFLPAPESINAQTGPNAPPLGVTNAPPLAAPKANVGGWRATTTSKPKKVLITAGHSDVTSGQTGAAGEKDLNIELVRWMQRNAAQYGVGDFVEFYIPPSTSTNYSFNDPRSNPSRAREAVAQGKQVIEIHNDEARGRSGVIPPRGGNSIWPLDQSLAGLYGSFGADHAGGLAIPNRGGTILEVGRMDAATLNASRSSDPAVRERLYQQLADPIMRAVRQERDRGGGAPAPAAATTPPAPPLVSARLIVGAVGNSGSSTGAHLHAEWEDKSRITASDLNQFILIGGKSPTSWETSSAYRSARRPDHLGVDIAGGNIEGQPIEIVANSGATPGTIAETKCPAQGFYRSPCGGGFGNNRFINTGLSTPGKGRIRLAHLSSVEPIEVSGAQTTSGGGQAKPNIQPSPTLSGLTVETEFQGVPRALRIIPGRTVLSFITNYDEWVERGGHTGNPAAAGIDPGVWIAKRYASWFIKEVEFQWLKGDLTIKIEGISPWGNWGQQGLSIPSFDEYLARESGTMKNYYDYIRSLGSLCYMLPSGGDSCTELCSEALTIEAFLNFGSNQNAPGGGNDGSTTTPSPIAGGPPAKCQYGGTRYPADRVNAIMSAAQQGGITTKAGLAGVVGNAIVESFDRIDPAAVNGRGCIGVFQWCPDFGRKADFERFARQQGKSSSDFGVQMQWFIAELRGADFQGKDTVASLNQQTDPRRAAFEFNRLFERAPGQKEDERQVAAESIFNGLTCT